MIFIRVKRNRVWVDATRSELCDLMKGLIGALEEGVTKHSFVGEDLETTVTVLPSERQP